MLRLNRRHVYRDNVAPSSGMKARAHTCARGRHPISMRGKWRLYIYVYFGFLQNENFAAIIIVTEINIW